MKLPTFKRTRGDSDGQAAPPCVGVPLWSFWLVAFAVVALLVAGGMAGLLVLDGQRTRALADHELDLRADALARRLSQSLGMYHLMLRGLAANPALLSLMDSGAAGQIAARERILAGIVPQALRVRLLKPGYDIADLQADPPLSYTSLALLRAAESAPEPPSLEVHQSQRAKLYLVGAAAIRGADGRVHGLLHLSLSTAPLRDAIDLLRSSPGRAALQQMVEGRPATLFGTSPAGDPTPPPDGVRPLTASHLRLVYWHGGDAKSPLVLPGLWLMALLVGACGLVIGLQYWRLRKMLESDQRVLLHLLEDALNGRKPRHPGVSLRDLVHTTELLIQQVKVQRVKDLHDDAAPPVPPPAIVIAEEVGQVPPEGKQQAVALRRKVVPAAPASVSLPEAIFRAYDIRGLVGQSLTPAVVRELGRAIGSQAYDQGQQTVIVARDARPSGADLSAALIAGLNASGRDVLDLGMVPLPVLYFATRFLGSNAGVMVTASRRPADYNGLKVVIGGEPVAGPGLLALRERVARGDLLEGSGGTQGRDLVSDYIERITEDVSIARPLKVVVDCGSGCAGLVAPRLFQTLGCEVVERFCEQDNSYPGHQPDPSRPENLKFLQASVLSEQADVGLAFDADGDRLGVVDSRGHIIWPDRLLMLLSADVLSRHPGGDVIFDVKCSRALASQILQNGGRPVMWKSGPTSLKAKLRETGALLAGEWSGHIIFQERWYGFDDALYAGARLLEILAVDPRSSAEMFEDFPEYLSTPEFYLEVKEGEQYVLIGRLQQRLDLLGSAKLTTIDGLRAEYEDGWGLVRASNTAPALNFRFEADSEQALGRIQGMYRSLLAAVLPGLKAPF